jgi:hypothetical protein
MRHSLIIHQATIGLTVLLAALLIFIPVNAKTAIPTTAADSSSAAEDITKLAKDTKDNFAQSRPRVVPSQLGVCALELIKLEKGRIAVCSDTNLAYSGILLDCADLDGAKAIACDAAMRTMPNRGKRKQLVPTAPSK